METDSEIDIINNLLEIEKDAASLINNAQIEAQKRVSDAKNKYNTEYKQKYDDIVFQLEKEYDSEIEKINKEYDDSISSFKNKLEEKQKNTNAFNSLLDKILFE